MKNSVRTSLAWSFASRYLTVALNFTSVVVLARLLTPEEIGIYSIAVAFFAIGLIVRDFGISEYIIQETDLTQEKLSSAFTVSLSICWSLAILFLLISTSVSEFYDRPELLQIFNWLVANFILIPFGTITLSMLKRQMEFKKLLLIEVSSGITHTTVGITAAYLGYSYMSLAWASVSGTFTTVFLLGFFRPKQLPWLPGIGQVRSVLNFGARVGWGNMAGYLSKVVPELIIGKVFGAHSVAILGKGLSTTQMFTDLVSKAIVQVMGPAFANTNRTNGDLKAAFLASTFAMTGIAWPFFSFFIVMAEPIILFLFGDQWMESVPLLKVASGASILLFSCSLTERVLISRGKANRFAYLYTAQLAIMILLVLIASSYSLYAVVWAIFIERAARVLLQARELKKEIQIKFSEYLPVLTKGSLVAVISMIPPLFFQLNIEKGIPIFFELLLTGFLSFCFWLAAVYLVNHPLSREINRANNFIMDKIRSHI